MFPHILLGTVMSAILGSKGTREDLASVLCRQDPCAWLSLSPAGWNVVIYMPMDGEGISTQWLWGWTLGRQGSGRRASRILPKGVRDRVAGQVQPQLMKHQLLRYSSLQLETFLPSGLCAEVQTLDIIPQPSLPGPSLPYAAHTCHSHLGNCKLDWGAASNMNSSREKQQLSTADT